jgi:Mn-dependent DtxR family transcriptional regulator
VIRRIQENPFMTYQEIQLTLALKISPPTLYRKLKESGYGNWRTQKCLKLTEEVAKLRYNRALKYKDYTDSDWDKSCMVG